MIPVTDTPFPSVTITHKEIEAARLSGDIPKATRLLAESAIANHGHLTEATGHQYALLLQAAKRYDAALDVLHLLHSQLPKNAQVVLQIGQCYELQGEYVKAKDAFKLSTELHAKDESQPDSCRAWFGLGSNYFRLGKPEEGLEAWERGLRERCDSNDGRFQRSHVLLATGRFAEGWADYESRKHLHGYKASVRARGLNPEALPPEWDGKAQGKVLVVGTFGAGDLIQFSRYIPEVIEWSRHTPHFACGEPLAPLLGYQEGGGCDYSVAIDSLPLLRGIYAPLGVDFPMRWWKPNNPKPRLGVCWEGSPGHLGNHDRSSPLDFRIAFGDPRWEIVSLQVGKGFQPKDYRETADVMQTLDAVVSVDTSVAHLAGTLGVPVVNIVPSSPEWRWGIKGDTTPWYPSMRIVRRTRWDAWPEAIAKAKKLLGEML